MRPIKRHAGVPTSLAGDPPIDYVILRENTEGLYASRGGGVRVGDRLATDGMVITRAGTERIGGTPSKWPGSAGAPPPTAGGV